MSLPKISKMHAKVNKTKPTVGVSVSGHIKENHFWDELNTLHSKSMTAIASANAYVVELIDATLSDPEKLAQIKDSAELASAVSTLDRDISAHYDRMNAILARHQGHTGGAKDIKDIQETIEIMDEYNTAANIYSTIIARDHQAIVELLGLEDDAAAIAAQAQSDLANPDIVSDIQVREPTAPAQDTPSTN